MSGVYHLLEPGGTPRGVLQRLDHSGIWMMIAGTFTPIHVILFRGLSRWLVLFVVWSIAITGLTLEVVFFQTFPEWLSLGLYLTLGWLGAGTYILYRKTYDDRLERFLVYGGVAYSVGGIFEFFRWPVLISGVAGPHEVFHFLVILAASFHAKLIYEISPIFITKKLTLRVKERGEHEAFIVATSEHLRIELKNKENLRERIAEELSSRYRKPWLPEAVRVKTEQENFLNPGDPGDNSMQGIDFYDLKGQEKAIRERQEKTSHCLQV